MENIIASIQNSLETKNWYSALVLSLIVPDICGKLEGGKSSSSKRYCEWFNRYLDKIYNGYLSAEDTYALRCSYLHEGSEIIENQKIAKTLDRFIFISTGPHCTRISNCHFDDLRYNGKEILQLSVYHFCQDIISAVEIWLIDVKNDIAIQENLNNMLMIQKEGFSIGNAIKFNKKN